MTGLSSWLRAFGLCAYPVKYADDRRGSLITLAAVGQAGAADNTWICDYYRGWPN